ncbi:SRPBCC family protein [Saccharopolyspora sp. CA-218241]|uniref:SRPBCC family protein n=1 Tax=Saccharopolyspora sp. CA-218241 TaxID=3240027 RepID=UPI003D976FB2
MNATHGTTDGRQVLRLEKRLPHAPEKVWRSITEPDQLSRWYPLTVTDVDLQIGGEIKFDDGEGTTYSGTITELEPHRVFAFNEEDDLLHLELRSDDRGTVLVLTHTFDGRMMVPATAAGWHDCLDTVEAVVEGRRADDTDRTVELHEHYVHEFGFDRGSLETSGTGWELRFDRPLMKQPVDVVWAALTADGPPQPGGAVPAAFTTPQVPASSVVSVEPPRRLEYDWTVDGSSVGRVGWELADGAGGARIVLTQTGPAELSDRGDAALPVWRQHIESVVGRLRSSAE